MSDYRDSEKLKITDADAEVDPADRMDAGMSAGSTSADATRGDNTGVLGDVAHPFDQTNGIVDSFDETHPGNVTGESGGEQTVAAGDDRAVMDVSGSDVDDDTRVVPPPLPPARP
jgi:hypothetical protein